MSYWHPPREKRGSNSVIADDNRSLLANSMSPLAPFMFFQAARDVGSSQGMSSEILSLNRAPPMLNENISMRQMNAESLNQHRLLSNGNVLMPSQNQNQQISNGNFLLPDLNLGPLSRTQFFSGGNASLQPISSVDSLSREQQLRSDQKRTDMNVEFSNQHKLLSNGRSIMLPGMNAVFANRRPFLYNGTISPSSRTNVNGRLLPPFPPKPSCGSPIPSLPNLNSSVENRTMMCSFGNERMVSPATPATMEKNRRVRTHDHLPREIIDLVDDEETYEDVQQKKSSTSQQFIAENPTEQCLIGNGSSFSFFVQQLAAENPSENFFSNLRESSQDIPSYQQKFLAENRAKQCFSTQLQSSQNFPFHQQESERRMVVNSSQILSLSQLGGEGNEAVTSSQILSSYRPDDERNVVVDSSQNLSSYHLLGEQNTLVNSSGNAPVSLGDRENQGKDFNRTPPQKPKRKKHRPKVIREGKPARTPKPATPKPCTPACAEMTGKPVAKRKYVRKKKDPNLQETPSSARGEIVAPDSQSKNKPISLSVLGGVADPENQSNKLSVRRSLKFELENSQVADGLLGSARMLFKENQLETEIRGATPETVATSTTISRIQFCQQQGPPVLESPEGRSAIGSMRDLNLVTDAHVSAHIRLANVSSVKDRVIPEMQKKRRLENEYNDQIGNGVSMPPSTPSRQKIIYPRGNAANEFTFAVPQGLTHEKRQALERMLVLNQAMRETTNRPAQAHNTTSHAIVDRHRVSNPAKCYSQLDWNQPSTPEKAAVHSNNPDYEIYGPGARVDLLKANQMKSRTVKRRKKEQVTLDNPISSNDKEMEHIPAACKTGSSPQTKSTLKGCRNRNANLQTSTAKGYQAISNLGSSDSPGLQSSAAVSYRDPVDDIISKLQHLNINDGAEDAIGLSENALVPYAGGGGAMVPFEGPFELKRRKPRPKVDLDPESSRVWNFLMGKGSSENEEGKDKEKWWEEERRVFRGRADSFIARMHLIQGDRRFSKWKGSVVDSVIGVFLTQNVSDHLSSSAFMCLAARFPPKSEGNNKAADSEIMKPIAVQDTIIWQDKMLEQEFSYQHLSVSNGSKQTVDSGMAKSCESPESSIGCVSVDYSKESTGFHERELGIGHESPNSVLGTTVTVVEAEDRPVEDIFSLQNSLALSHRCEGQDQSKPSPLLTLVAEDLLNGGTTNGFSSFMELLHMENERSDRGLLELNGSGNGRILSAEYSGDCSAHLVMDNSPPVPYLPTYVSCSDPSICRSNICSRPLQYELPSLSCAPQSYYLKENTGLIGLEKSSTAVNKNDQSHLNLSASETTETNAIRVMGKQFGPYAGKATNDLNRNKLLGSRVAPSPFSCASAMNSAQPITSPGIGVATEKLPCSPSEMYSNIQSYNICISQQGGNAAMYQGKENDTEVQVERSLNKPQVCNQSCRTIQPYSNSDNENTNNNLDAIQAPQSNSVNEACISQKPSAETLSGASKGKKAKAEENFDWDSLRREACQNGTGKERSSETMDSLDYEAVRCADVNEISHAIRERGMNNMLAERIKDFLNRLVRDHGSIDLEWLRDAPPAKVKDYLLSIRGLGLKSVECVRLLTLHHLAFPVDTNVGRICVRLGWVPLQPLPESLQLHLLEMYPMLETIQKYLWPRLCKLDQRTLYELHYQLITFGKVFCTKSKPNCNACPMRGECKHFASAFASARLALPGPEEKSVVPSEVPIAFETNRGPVPYPMPLPLIEGSSLLQKQTVVRNCEPIIEEPASPEPERIETSEIDIEDAFYNDPDDIPTIKLNFEKFAQNLQNLMQENNMGIQDGDLSKALIAITPELASIPTPKLKNVSRLRTEHQVYELPDTHPLLEGLDKREPDDPCPYLLAIWTPGETAQSTEPPTAYCNSQETGKLCDKKTCFSCNSIREAQAQMVRGTLLIPCRTANRGSFPLNGTYFQVNEVFADHHSSRNPIDVPRDWIWNLPRRIVYFGTSIPSIFKGLTTEGIQHCFWRGFVCVRGFDQTTRAPKPLFARLHIAASKVTRNRKTAATAAARKE